MGGSASAYLIEEPPTVQGTQKHPNLRMGPIVLHEDRNFRRFVIVRMLLASSQMATPFFTIYAIEELGIPIATIGLYVALFTGSRLAANVLWSWIASRHGSVALLRASIPLNLCGTLLAISVPSLLRIAPSLGPSLLIWYGLVFLLNGSGFSGRIIALQALGLDISPETLRPTYIGVLNTMAGVASLTLILGGPLIAWHGFPAVFIGSAALLLLALGTTHRLHARTLSPEAVAALTIASRTHQSASSVASPEPSSETNTSPARRISQIDQGLDKETRLLSLIHI